MLWGLAAAALWPLYYSGLLGLYPGVLHARWMILGWGGAMVLGFLGTAGPRMMEVRSLTHIEVLVLLTLHGVSMAAFVSLGEPFGCGVFAVTLVFLIGCFGRRFSSRRDLPPPRFVLALAGLIFCIVGCVSTAAGWNIQYGATSFLLTRLLMNEGFLLLPLLGIGGFLIPRIAGLPVRRSYPESPYPPSRLWWSDVFISAVAAILLLLSLVVEAKGHIAWAMPLRLFTVVAIWAQDMPKLWMRRVPGTQAWMVRLGLSAMPLAWLLRWMDPVRLYAVEHVLFITGFGVVMLAVASRVTDGHSGHREEARGRSRTLRWVFWLALLAMLTRVSADYVPNIQISHYIYAAVTWVIVMVIWLWRYRHKLRQAEVES